MKKIFTLLLLAILCGTQQMLADDGFRPYKGICWGTFYYDDLVPMDCSVLAVHYERRAEDTYVLPDFVGCGKDLIVTFGQPNEEGYCGVALEMDGGAYDNAGYFYAPFTSGDYNWTITASNGELMGPIHQYYSYYHEPLDYIGLFFVSYPDVHFAYFDVKLDQDYYEDYPRQYMDETEEGISSLETPSLAADTYYDLAGCRVAATASGLKIAGGRKFISK